SRRFWTADPSAFGADKCHHQHGEFRRVGAQPISLTTSALRNTYSKPDTVWMRTTRERRPTTATHTVATALKIGPFLAGPSTVDLLARIKMYVSSSGVMTPLSTWALTTSATRLPGASATMAPTMICSVNMP